MADHVPAYPVSGLAPGEPLTAFAVEAVTGAFSGERLCYVCRYGDRPGILVFSQQADRHLARLAKALDLWAARQPEACVWVVVTASDPEGEAEALRKLAREYMLRLPLTVCVEGEFGPHGYRLHPRVPTTVILYREKTVVATLTGTPQDSEFRAGVLAAAELLASSGGDDGQAAIQY